jgi:hypothetical protein
LGYFSCHEEIERHFGFDLLAHCIAEFGGVRDSAGLSRSYGEVRYAPVCVAANPNAQG